MQKVIFKGRFTIFLMAVLFQVMAVGGLRAEQPQASKEYLLKAAFLYNFAKFVEWPKEAFTDNEQEMQVCILGKDPFGPALDMIRNKMVGKREVRVENIKMGPPDDDCQIIFLSKALNEKSPLILEKIKGRPILTVSDMEGFAQTGGIIELEMVKGKIRFSINLEAAEQNGIKISSKLLRLARTVLK